MHLSFYLKTYFPKEDKEQKTACRSEQIIYFMYINQFYHLALT